MVCLSVLFSGKASELAHYIPGELHFVFAPLNLFLQNIQNKVVTYEVNMGIMLSLSMATSGLTSVTFGDPNINGLYMLFFSLLITGCD